MTGEMATCILNPQQAEGEPVLPATGILAVNPSDTRCLIDYAEHLGLKRHFLFNSTLYSSHSLFLAGPAVGAPMAVLCLEKLIALGAKKIILYGWCGSLQDNLHAMDVLVPGSGVSEEGTSSHYPSGTKNEIAPCSAFREHLCRILTENSISFQQGSVWTTDAPYRETEHKVTALAAQGVYGVDMEYSALCTVAAFRKVRFAAVMLVSDELLNAPWKPRYSFKSFKKRSRLLLTMLSDAAQCDAI
jgi:purine-nucleoside phosphorylase